MSHSHSHGPAGHGHGRGHGGGGGHGHSHGPHGGGENPLDLSHFKTDAETWDEDPDKVAVRDRIFKVCGYVCACACTSCVGERMNEWLWVRTFSRMGGCAC